MKSELPAAPVKSDRTHVSTSLGFKRIGLVMLIAVIMALILIAPQLAQAERHVVSPTAQWIVNTTVDETDGSCSDGDCSLRDAIALATNGDTINFDASLAGQTITLTGQLEITRSLTVGVRGSGSTVPLSAWAHHHRSQLS